MRDNEGEVQNPGQTTSSGWSHRSGRETFYHTEHDGRAVCGMKHQPPSARHTDLRPFLKDAVTGKEYLFDTGSQVTAIPPQAGDVPDPSIQLDAVNGTSLRTYGTKEIQIKVGRHTYSYVALKADVLGVYLQLHSRTKRSYREDRTIVARGSRIKFAKIITIATD